MKWTPDTVLGIIIVVGCFTLWGIGIDGEVKSILALAAGAVFGAQYQVRKLSK